MTWEAVNEAFRLAAGQNQMLRSVLRDRQCPAKHLPSKEGKEGVNLMQLQECVKFHAVLHRPSGMLLANGASQIPTTYTDLAQAEAFAKGWAESMHSTGCEDDLEVVQVQFRIVRKGDK